jgi:hypothetical protein
LNSPLPWATIPQKGCRWPGILAIKDFLQLLSKGVFG